MRESLARGSHEAWDMIGMGDHEVIEVEAHGHTLRWVAYPGRLTNQWRKGRLYEQPLLDRIYDLGLPAGALAVDAGANLGNHTIWMSVVCGLRVAAIEPIKTGPLERNLSLNDIPLGAVEIHAVALGAESGSATHVGSGTLDPDEGVGGIPIATLDSLRLSNVALVKADVEGMEPELLSGAEKTINESHPVLFVECHPGQSEKIAAVVGPWGYAKYGDVRNSPNATPMEEWRFRYGW